MAFERASFAQLVYWHPEFEALTQHLSITTFRYVPRNVSAGSQDAEDYLQQLNQELLSRVEAGAVATFLGTTRRHSRGRRR